MKTGTLSLLLPLLSVGAGVPSEIDALVNRAAAARGEFAADVLIRLAALDAVPKSRKIEILEQAFQRAGEAQQPYKRRASIVRLDGPAGFLNRAYDQELDGLSLRVRVMAAMLPLDGRKARALLSQIPGLNIPKVTCDEFLVYDASRFYETLGKIAGQTFTPEEVQKHEPSQLLDRYISAVTSPVEVGPAAGLLASTGLRNDDFRALVTRFAGMLGKIAEDDRSFTYSRMGTQILALVEECKRREISPLPLLEGYRLYLVTHLSGKRCADDDLMQGGGHSFGLATGAALDPQAAEGWPFFNEKLRMPPLQPIQEQEVTPSALEGAASGLRSCADPECRDIARLYRALIFDANGAPHAQSEKSTLEWETKLRNFLSALADWKQSADTGSAAYFREKCGFYSDSFNLAPPGPLRELVLTYMLGYLKQNRFQTEDAIQWFLPVNALIGRVALDPAGMRGLAEQLRRSNDPLIALYADLEQLAPRSPERIMPLL